MLGIYAIKLLYLNKVQVENMLLVFKLIKSSLDLSLVGVYQRILMGDNPSKLACKARKALAQDRKMAYQIFDTPLSSLISQKHFCSVFNFLQISTKNINLSLKFNNLHSFVNVFWCQIIDKW